MATTTTVDTQAIVAGSGGTSTPVKLTLQSGTQAVSVQIKVTTTRTTSPTESNKLRKEFTLYWAFSPEDLTLADVPSLLRHCAKSQAMVLNPDIERAGQRQQIRDKVNGQYMYLWFGYPQSADAYSVVLQTTELFFLSSATDPTFTTITLTGQAKFADGTAAAPSISFASDTDTGFYRTGSGTIAFSSNGSIALGLARTGTTSRVDGAGGNSLSLLDAGAVSLIAGGTNQNITLTPSGTGSASVFNASASPVFAIDTSNAAADPTLAFSFNGTAGATIKRTSATGTLTLDTIGNFPFVIRSNSLEIARFIGTGATLLGTSVNSGALLQIGTNTTTSAGGMVFGTDTFLFRSAAGAVTLNPSSGEAKFILNVGGVVFTAQTSGGNSFLDSAGSLNLRTNGTTIALTLDSSQNAFFANNVEVGLNADLRLKDRLRFYAPSDGVLRLTNIAGTDFTRLQFGGTTASFPALARTTTELIAQLADASATTYIKAKLRASNGTAGANFGPGAVTSITVVDGVITAIS